MRPAARSASMPGGSSGTELSVLKCVSPMERPANGCLWVSNSYGTDPYREKVGARVSRSATEVLGCDVARRASHAPGWGLEAARNAEIHHADGQGGAFSWPARCSPA